MARNRRKTRGRKTREQDGDIPVDSFSDIAFLLIIFFVFAASLASVVGLESDLPSGEKTEATEQDEDDTVRLNGDQIRLGKRQVTIEELRKELQDMQLETLSESDRIIKVEANGQVNFQRYSEVMAAISSAGGELGLTMDAEEGE
ncbi:MAG: ExbD/TolR family protein [Phycisphaerae bacterium]